MAPDHCTGSITCLSGGVEIGEQLGGMVADDPTDVRLNETFAICKPTLAAIAKLNKHFSILPRMDGRAGRLPVLD